METNTANERRGVFALTYTAHELNGYCAGVFDLYETLSRARIALRETINHLRNEGYALVIDDKAQEHYILYHRELQREYHLFIESRLIN